MNRCNYNAVIYQANGHLICYTKSFYSERALFSMISSKYRIMYISTVSRSETSVFYRVVVDNVTP